MGSAANLTDATTPQREPQAVTPIVELLARVEAATRGESGALGIYDARGARLGEFVVNRGRICLVAGVPGVPRLGDMLSLAHPEYARRVGEALAQAQREGRLLGDVLLELGTIPAAYLRASLLQQVALCSARMSVAAAQPGTSTRLRRATAAFDNSLCFAPVDVYLEAATHLDAARDSVASRIYYEFCGMAATAALFCHEEQRTWATAVTGVPIATFGDLCTLSRHARPRREMRDLGGDRPQLVSMGAPSYRCVWVLERNATALIGGVDVSEESRVLGRAALRIRQVYGLDAGPPTRL